MKYNKLVQECLPAGSPIKVQILIPRLTPGCRIVAVDERCNKLSEVVAGCRGLYIHVTHRSLQVFASIPRDNKMLRVAARILRDSKTLQ